MTNNRQTVVIQDEIAFNGAQSAAWIAHTKASITLSEDKRTAYLSGDGADGKVEYIRVSIVSPDPNLKFEVMTCGITMGANGKLQDALLEGLKDPNYSFSHGGVREKSRDNLRRLVIKVSNTMTFECAVVIEDIYSAEEVTPVTYDFARINTWDEVGIYETYTGSNAGNTGGGSSGNDETITSAKIGDIRTYSAQAKKLVDSGYALDTRITDFFRSLVRVNAAVNTYRPETFQNIPQIWSAYQEYLGYIEYYKSYSASINDSFALSHNVSVGLTGK
jgi:hypothetical protein